MRQGDRSRLDALLTGRDGTLSIYLNNGGMALRIIHAARIAVASLCNVHLTNAHSRVRLYVRDPARSNIRPRAARAKTSPAAARCATFDRAPRGCLCACTSHGDSAPR